ncbi:hypothetical protein OJ252_3239 [Cryptosporidium canis]|uniref:Signal peptide-containing protein n=1 Tax=Cryptosporidium canis TaxID=195482 RepID=A0ABQ8P5X8_9CRYT|nr:hypothetical protein OJ252_3239 [Cryptosporidium canis]
MKLIISLIHIYLFFELVFRYDHGETNKSLNTPTYSFIKLKASYNLQGGGSGDDKKEPKLLSVTDKSSPPPSPKPPRPRQEPKRRPGPLTRMPSWPPTERKRTGLSPTQRPTGPLGERFDWPPRDEKKRSSSFSQTPVSQPQSPTTDPEDGWFTAVKVTVREGEGEDEDVDLSKLAVRSDSDSDSDTSPPGTPVRKEAFQLPPSELTPQEKEKIQVLREKYSSSIKRRLSRGDMRRILNDTKLGKKMLVLPIPLLLELLEKILTHYIPGGPSTLPLTEIKDIATQENEKFISRHSGFSANLRDLSQLLSDTKTEVRQRYKSKYGTECSFETLKTLALEYERKYFENADVDERIASLSDPRAGAVANRGEKLTLAYKELKASLSQLRSIKVKFMECYVSYVDSSEEKTKVIAPEECTWSDLVLLKYMLTSFKGLAMLTGETVMKYENKIKVYEEGVGRNPADMRPRERKLFLEAKELVEKLKNLRLEYELFGMFGPVLSVIIAKCMKFLENTA